MLSNNYVLLFICLFIISIIFEMKGKNKHIAGGNSDQSQEEVGLEKVSRFWGPFLKIGLGIF